MHPSAPHLSGVRLCSPGSGRKGGHRVSPGGPLLPCRGQSRCPGGNVACNMRFGGSSTVTTEKLPPGFSVLSGNPQGLRDQPANPNSSKHPPLVKPPSPAGAHSAPHESPNLAGHPAPATRLPPTPVARRAFGSHGGLELPHFQPRRETTRSPFHPTLSPGPGLGSYHSGVFPAKTYG